MSVIRVDNFGPSAGGTTYSARGIAKAWVNFNGTGTIAARDSENVSSLTDNGTGDYTVNFSNAFGAADYSLNKADSFFSLGDTEASSFSAGSARVRVYSDFSTLTDTIIINVAAHGDLA